MRRQRAPYVQKNWNNTAGVHIAYPSWLDERVDADTVPAEFANMTYYQIMSHLDYLNSYWYLVPPKVALLRGGALTVHSVCVSHVRVQAHY